MERAADDPPPNQFVSGEVRESFRHQEMALRVCLHGAGGRRIGRADLGAGFSRQGVAGRVRAPLRPAAAERGIRPQASRRGLSPQGALTGAQPAVPAARTGAVDRCGRRRRAAATIPKAPARPASRSGGFPGGSHRPERAPPARPATQGPMGTMRRAARCARYRSCENGNSATFPPCQGPVPSERPPMTAVPPVKRKLCKVSLPLHTKPCPVRAATDGSASPVKWILHKVSLP